MMIVDAHLDLSYNAVRGRAVELPAREQSADEEGIPTVGLPDLRRGGVGLVCATIFCEPAHEGGMGYGNGDEAHSAAMTQVDWYQRQISAGAMRLVGDPAEIKNSEADESPTNAILLLEGADPIRDDRDLRGLFESGLRIVGLAWKEGTRYAGGNAKPGPLTADGVRLVKSLDRMGIIHDVSHLAEEAFWQLAELSAGPMMASHSNCRAIVPGDRQLSDAMIRAIADRGGVIGINFFDKFLLPPDQYGKRRATLGDVCDHVKHICDLLGSAENVGLGTDMDGGLGREQIPIEIETSADLIRMGDALGGSGFGDEDVRRVLGGNWARFFSRCLARPSA